MPIRAKSLRLLKQLLEDRAPKLLGAAKRGLWDLSHLSPVYARDAKVGEHALPWSAGGHFRIKNAEGGSAGLFQIRKVSHVEVTPVQAKGARGYVRAPKHVSISGEGISRLTDPLKGLLEGREKPGPHRLLRITRQFRQMRPDMNLVAVDPKIGRKNYRMVALSPTGKRLRNLIERASRLPAQRVQHIASRRQSKEAAANWRKAVWQGRLPNDGKTPAPAFSWKHWAPKPAKLNLS